MQQKKSVKRFFRLTPFILPVLLNRQFYNHFLNLMRSVEMAAGLVSILRIQNTKLTCAESDF